MDNLDKDKNTRSVSPIPVKKPKSSKLSQIKESLFRMQLKYKESNSKIEEIRKKVVEEELEKLQDRPQINSLSRKYSANVLPIYKRVDTLVRTRNENMKCLQLEVVKKRTNEEALNCTFSPKINQNYQTSNLDFSQKVDKWIQQSQLAKEKREQEKITRDLRDVTSKPDICKKSRKLARQRPHTPVSERLYRRCSPSPKS